MYLRSHPVISMYIFSFLSVCENSREVMTFNLFIIVNRSRKLTHCLKRLMSEYSKKAFVDLIEISEL